MNAPTAMPSMCRMCLAKSIVISSCSGLWLSGRRSTWSAPPVLGAADLSRLRAASRRSLRPRPLLTLAANDLVRCRPIKALTQQRYVIRHRIHVAGILSPCFLIQFEQIHPGRRGRKSARSRTCRQSRTGDRLKLQPVHQELHHLLELSVHDPPARGRQDR